MNWIVYALACVFLYGIMQFFMKFASGASNPIASSVVFIAAQFTAQVLLGAYFISKSGFDINYDGVKYGVAGGIAAGVSTFLFFLALQQAPLSKVGPIVNMNVVVGVMLAVIFLNEAMNPRIAAGIFLAVASIYLLTSGS